MAVALKKIQVPDITQADIDREIEYRKYNKIVRLFPDIGPFRRELYHKHLEFFAAGARYKERALAAGNRVGKTVAGAYEMACHLTGIYPKWWTGKRFTKPIDAWAAGKTSISTRDIIQKELLGALGDFGTGTIPKHLLEKTFPKTGTPGGVEIIHVKHVSGGTSMLFLKSYDQGMEKFMGTAKDVIWLDEEPPLAIYTECFVRTTTTNGIVMLTFTPLLGLTETVLEFLPGGVFPEVFEGSKHVTSITWDDAPHLTPEQKETLWNGIPPFQRDARSKGIPQLGSGAIYQVPESDIIVPDFAIPNHFRRCFGFDVGWNCTAAIWLAQDPDSGIVYAYQEHYRGQAEPVVHAEAIRARGEWIPGVIDPAARGRGQKDGIQLYNMYKDLGLALHIAQNATEAGIYQVWEMFSQGRLKIFASLGNTRAEYRIYRRDEKGRIVKEKDHLMDALRYAIMSGLDLAKQKPVANDNNLYHKDLYGGGGGESWMA